MKIKTFSEEQNKLFRKLLSLTDNQLEKLLKEELKIDMKFGPIPFDSDEKLLIAIAIVTDYSTQTIKKKLEDLSKQKILKGDTKC